MVNNYAECILYCAVELYQTPTDCITNNCDCSITTRSHWKKLLSSAASSDTVT